MQRDIDLTIGDIVWDLEDCGIDALAQFSEHVVHQDTHTNLRFLKIPHLTEYSDLYPEVTCELTEKGDHPEETGYVAVSYCWHSFNGPGSNEEEHSSSLPKVLVKQRDKPLRAPRCPIRVLVRAIAFAVSMGASFIWIDQECVNQEDPIDIENHLQWNHIIFHQAKFKIGLLSYELSATQVKNLATLEIFHALGVDLRLAHLKTHFAEYGLKSVMRDTQTITRVLKSIARDRWFTRTWVLQERFSASLEMDLLLPLSCGALRKFDNPFRKQLVGEDFSLPVETVCTVAIAMRFLLSDLESAQMLQEDIAVRDAFRESLNSLHEAAQLLGGPIFSGTSLDRMFETSEEVRNRLITADDVRDSRLCTIFREIENCDNRVVSDRLAILANIMGFGMRFPTDSFKSYSFALVALMSANYCFPMVLIRDTTSTRPLLPFSRPAPASVMITLVYHLKELIAEGNVRRQQELENVSRALTNFFGRDIARHARFEDIVNDAIQCLPCTFYGDPFSFLSKIDMQITCQSVVPLSATIDDIVGGIVTQDHIDNVGLQCSHGETIVRHGIGTNQLKAGVEFISFAGGYRWRSEFIEKFFN